MVELILLLLAGLLLIAGIVVLQAGEGAQWRRDLVAYRLQFPYGLKPEAVTAFVAGLAGLIAPRGRRWLVARGVVFEVCATEAGITHHLLVARAQESLVLSALRAHLPAVRVTPDPDHHPVRPVLAAELGLSDYRRPLATGKSEAVSAAILASLQPLASEERLVAQWVVRPAAPVPALPTRPHSRTPQTGLAQLLWGQPAAIDDLPALRAKQAHPLLLATGRLGVTTDFTARAKTLLTRLTAACHTANAPGAHLYRRSLPSRVATRNLSGRFLSLVVPPCALNAAELAMLLAFPTGTVALPGLRLGGTRLLAPSTDIPAEGRVVARSSFPGAERPLALSVADSLQHLHVIGPTGVGKSTALLNLITQDMAAGRGVVVVDPKGDLVADVLDRVPSHRTGDVAVLDPTDEARPVGLNLLSGAGEAPELVVDQVVGTLHNLFANSWGPRTDDILRASLLTLVHAPGMTVCEVPLLLTDPGFRRRLVGRVDDPVALGPFWGWFEGLSDAERIQAIGPVLNKLRAFLLRRRLRNVLGQADSLLDLGRVLAERRILLVPLTKGLLGEEAAALLGSLVVARLWQAVQGRAGQRPETRRPVFAYIDEFQDFLYLPLSVADLLAQARGLRLGLTLAHQHLGQLPTSVREAVLANARSRVIFQTSASDARVLGRELAPYLTAADLQGLGAYEVVASLSAGVRVAPPVTGFTLPPPPATGLGEVARTASRMHYGRERSDIEAAIRARHEGGAGRGRVGRREVSS